MPVARRTLLRLRRCPLRLRRGVASAANAIDRSGTFIGTRWIGEKVIGLRNSCTGLAPVHFFQKVAGAALGALLAASPLATAPAAAAPATLAASPVGQSVDDFYRA